MRSFTDARDTTRRDWTLKTMVPDWITDDLFAEAVDRTAAGRRPSDARRVEPAKLRTILRQPVAARTSTS